jgi:hypothetical protein
MRVRQGLTVAFATIGVAVVACGGSASSSCSDYLNAAISYGQKCGTSLTTVDDAAKNNFEKLCTALSTAPGASDFPSQIEKCASRLGSIDCNASLSCSVKGTLPDGAACGAATQCAGGLCNTSNTPNPSSELTCGTCASYVALGSACSSGKCDPTMGACENGTCVAFATQGQSCTAAPCGSDLLCDTTTHTCQPFPTKGAACTFECAYPYKCSSQTCIDPVAQGGACPTGNECASNLACDPQTKTCVTPTLAAAGQPCGFVTNQFVACQSGLKCSNGQPQTCVVPKAAGEACVVGNDECQAYLVCVNATCQVPDYSLCK